MAIFVDETTKVIVQGLTGGQGRFHGVRNRDYGTKVVGGVTPGKGGEDVEGIPVFDSGEGRRRRDRGDGVVRLRPADARAIAAILEAAEAGITLRRLHHRGHPRPRRGALLQPARRGLPRDAAPRAELPGHHQPRDAATSASPRATSRCPAAPSASSRARGRSPTRRCTSCPPRASARRRASGIGGDPVPGTNFIDCLAAFEADDETQGRDDDRRDRRLRGGARRGVDQAST